MDNNDIQKYTILRNQYYPDLNSSNDLIKGNQLLDFNFLFITSLILY